MNEVNDWLGRTEGHADSLRVQPARFMQAALGRTPDLADGDVLPPLWHWLYFLEAEPAGGLGRDGHPAKGGFLPPVALPRRMWAGGRFTFHTPLRVGDGATKRSTITSIESKVGRTGPLCFVTVRHEISSGGVLAITEEQDIVYRDDPDPDASPQPSTRAPDDADVSETVQPTPVLLFRYSALTFNGHRIHYDADYARSVEGYDGVVFHGPLTATLLVDLAVRTVGRHPSRFGFRGTAPIAGDAPFRIEGARDGNVMRLWARRGDGALAMRAEATFE